MSRAQAKSSHALLNSNEVSVLIRPGLVQGGIHRCGLFTVSLDCYYFSHNNFECNTRRSPVRQERLVLSPLDSLSMFKIL